MSRRSRVALSWVLFSLFSPLEAQSLTFLTDTKQLLFQAFAKLAEEADARKESVPLAEDEATLSLLSDATPAELQAVNLDKQLEEDLVNVLTEDMDPKVSYREAVSSATRRERGLRELTLAFRFALL